MDRNYDNVIKSVNHLKILHNTFLKEENFTDVNDFIIYKQNSNKLTELLAMPEVELYKQLYSAKSRQMILADIIEYILLARGIFFVTDGTNKASTKLLKKSLFIKTIMYFVNLLMSYESMTVDNKLRKTFLINLSEKIPEVMQEELYQNLLDFTGKVGLTEKESDAEKPLNNYFDKILPKTAGGLWHELLVYIFLLRNNLGYIVPLLLTQKFVSRIDTIVPPDFLLITKDKNIYGIEVGIKKEIQSGAFSLLTNIPTATIDTINSRCSDRCPICKKWILFCDKVINEFSDLEKELGKGYELRCLEHCDIHNREEIVNGKCVYAKYSRGKTKKINHKYTDKLHYHYTCVLNKLPAEKREELIEIQDSTAIKAHYPYYAGLEPLSIMH
jgi:hypothetical protein